MKGILVVVLSILWPSWAFNITGPDYNEMPCWQQCFYIDEYPEFEHLKPAYNDIFEAGMEAARLAAMYSVNGTAILIDSTLSPYHSNANALHPEEKGMKIFQFQKDMASIVSMMLTSWNDTNPIFVTQFDEEKGWTCDDWNCLGSCAAVDAISLLECVHTDASSYRDNKIEPACRMADEYMTTDAGHCVANLENEMAIAFVNSDFDHNVRRVAHEHGKYRTGHYSACQAHFKTRMVVGTHAVDSHEMDDWQSPDARYKYIRDNPYTMEAARSLVGCMKSFCCPIDYRHRVLYPQNDTCYSITDDYSMSKSMYRWDYDIPGDEVPGARGMRYNYALPPPP